MAHDAASVLLDGPWEHRFVAANGARFHVAEQGAGPLVLFLHGFPQFWWAWRHQLPELADAGFRACAMDLRGFGASDKPPRGYDTPTTCADVASVVRSLGETDAVIVGQGLGAWVAWSMPACQPAVTRAVGALAMAHPRALRHATVADPRQARANAWIGGLQRPFVPERQMTSDGGYVQRLLREWASPESGWPTAGEGSTYAEAAMVPFVAHSAAEYYRWIGRSQLRPDGWRFAARMGRPIDVPVLQLHGTHDGAVLTRTAASSTAYVAGPFEFHEVTGAGHFLGEEAPATVGAHLRRWLDESAG